MQAVLLETGKEKRPILFAPDHPGESVNVVAEDRLWTPLSLSRLEIESNRCDW